MRLNGLIAAGAAALLTIGAADRAALAEESGSLTILRSTAPDNIDPAMTCTIFGGSLVNNLYDRLVEYKKTDQTLGPDVEPMAAESWEISPDGLQYSFKIRQGMKFSSGNPVTAADVAYSLERTQKLGGCQGYNLEGGLTGNVIGISAPDAATVVVKLKQPDPLFLSDLTNNIGIVEKAVLEAHGGMSKEGTAWLSSNAAGSGPFTLSGYDPESQIILEARQDYWAGKAASNRLIFQIAKDPSTIEVLLNSGAADVAYDVPSQDIDRIAQNPNLKAVAGPALTYVNVGLNVTKPPLDDLRVRQALTYATPFKDIMDAFAGGYGHPLVGPIMIGQPFQKSLENPYPLDLKKAKELIDQAGARGKTLTLVVKSGQSVQQEIATVLQANWTQIGINLEIRTLGSSAFFDAVMELKHDMYMIEDKSANPDPGYLLSFFVRCKDPYNWTGYCDPEIDQWLAGARSSLDQDQRAEAYGKIAEKVARDAPYIQLFQKDLVMIAKKSVEGFVFSPESEDRYFWLKRN